MGWFADCGHVASPVDLIDVRIVATSPLSSIHAIKSAISCDQCAINTREKQTPARKFFVALPGDPELTCIKRQTQ
jgi:hypothetical protein